MLGAVELGGTKVVCAVGDAHDRIYAETRIETRDPTATLRDVLAFFAPHRGTLSALGVAAFGPIELEGAGAGTLLETPKLAWRGTPLRRALHDALGVAIHIDTDVNAAALGEQRFGAGDGADPCVYITVGTGIGVGVVIDGKPLHGLLHPELGHMPARAAEGFAGVCPYHGACIEGVASAPALRAQLGFDPADAEDDDPVWDREAEQLAALVATCVLAYAPRRVLLGGGVLERPALLDKTRAATLRALNGYLARPALSPAGIASFLVAPRHGLRAGLVGAFALCAS